MRDTTPPSTPGIVRAMAFDRAKEGTATYSGNGGGANTGAYRDPTYIELNNVEGGTTIELVNLSKNPAGTFEKDALKFDPTGRDVAARTASIYLTDAQMDEVDLEPGDIFLIRARDAAGNVSGQVRGEIEPDDWANMNVAVEDGSTWTRGTVFSALDGEGMRKNIIARIVADGRPPVVLEGRLTLQAGPDGAVSLRGDFAMEPAATLSVQNQRTGAVVQGIVAGDSTLTIPLGKDVQAKDPLILRPVDHEGHAGKEVRLTYAPGCEGGKAPVIGSLAARLPGVI